MEATGNPALGVVVLVVLAYSMGWVMLTRMELTTGDILRWKGGLRRGQMPLERVEAVRRARFLGGYWIVHGGGSLYLFWGLQRLGSLLDAIHDRHLGTNDRAGLKPRQGPADRMGLGWLATISRRPIVASTVVFVWAGVSRALFGPGSVSTQELVATSAATAVVFRIWLHFAERHLERNSRPK